MTQFPITALPVLTWWGFGAYFWFSIFIEARAGDCSRKHNWILKSKRANSIFLLLLLIFMAGRTLIIYCSPPSETQTLFDSPLIFKSFGDTLLFLGVLEILIYVIIEESGRKFLLKFTGKYAFVINLLLFPIAHVYQMFNEAPLEVIFRLIKLMLFSACIFYVIKNFGVVYAVLFHFLDNTVRLNLFSDQKVDVLVSSSC